MSEHEPKSAKLSIGLLLDDSLDKPDGVQQYVLTLGKWLTQQGHIVHYIAGQTSRTDLVGIHSVSKNVKVNFNGNRLSIPLPTPTGKIREILKHQSFDVLHVQMPHSPFMAAKVVRLMPPTTAIFGTFHIAPYAALDTHATWLLGVWLKRNLRLFDEIISVSSAAQAFALRTFRIKTRVIPNAVDVSSFSSIEEKSQKQQIVCLGRLVPRKGCMELLKAYSLLQQQSESSIPLIICGDGPERPRLEVYCAEQGLSQVIFKGFVSEAQKKEYLAGSSVAVFPSVGGESFGIVLLEAMAAGSGVVLAGDNPGYRSVLGEIKDTMFDPKDTQVLAQKLQAMITNNEQTQQIHKQQQELVKRYDIAVVGNQIVDSYQQAIAKKRRETHNK